MRLVVLALISVLCTVSCNSPQARLPVTKKSGTFIKESAERNKKLNESEHQIIQDLIKKNDTSFLRSDSGFYYAYKLQNETDGYTPQFGDLVNFNYNIKDLNGGIIYSEEELQTQNYLMDKQRLFTGLREGLKLMKEGEQVTFIFPSQVAFGYYGDENKIGMNTPIICDVKINSITKKESN
jgi:gliding motility-associated peptidyl-prolyl isomerase